MSRRPRGSTAARGYGSQHQREREKYKPAVDAGAASCCRCGLPIPPGGIGPCPAIRTNGRRCGKNHRGWDLGHADWDRTQWVGVEHVCCNRATAGRRKHRNHRIVAKVRDALRTSREW